MQSSLLFFIIAFVASLIPIFLWLWFLEHEDKNPEPKKLVLLAFFAGMLAVGAVIPLEKFVADHTSDMFILILCWAAIEELMKYIMVYIFALRRKENDEPIDGLMYIIATALGFSALENALFIFRPLIEGNFLDAFILSNFRFIGATLLHTVSSSIIGIALAYGFYKTKSHQRMYLYGGVVLAIVLHTFFNLTIMVYDGSRAMIAFYTVWVALVILLLLIEKVKKIKSQ